MTIQQYLSQYGSYLTGHLRDGFSTKKEAIILPVSVLDEITKCFSQIQTLNEYIYKNHFHKCLEYLDIKNDLVKELMINQYPKTNFLDHNIISRLDLFFTNKGIQLAEINHDTPGGWIETYFLNKMTEIEPRYINPNTRFPELFGNAFLRRGIKDIVLLTGLGSRLDKKMLSFLAHILDYYKIPNKTGIFEGITDKNGSLYLGEKKLATIHKDIPIDRICNNYDTNITHKFIQNIGNDTISLSNNPVSYLFQVKSYFAFLYEHIEKFPYKIQKIIYAYIPLTKKLDKLEAQTLSKDRRVIKHVNKRLGQDVYIGNKTNEKEWLSVIKNSDNQWIIQEYFEVLPILNKYINFGVYGIDGKFGGVYTRISSLSGKTTEIDDYSCPIFFA